jgi:hypothetical protein
MESVVEASLLGGGPEEGGGVGDEPPRYLDFLWIDKLDLVQLRKCLMFLPRH